MGATGWTRGSPQGTRAACAQHAAACARLSYQPWRPRGCSTQRLSRQPPQVHTACRRADSYQVLSNALVSCCAPLSSPPYQDVDYDGEGSLWTFLEDLTGVMIRCGMPVVGGACVC